MKAAGMAKRLSLWTAAGDGRREQFQFCHGSIKTAPAKIASSVVETFQFLTRCGLKLGNS